MSNPRLTAERAQHIDVVVEQLGAGGVAQRRPVAALGNLDGALVCHLEEE